MLHYTLDMKELLKDEAINCSKIFTISQQLWHAILSFCHHGKTSASFMFLPSFAKDQV